MKLNYISKGNKEYILIDGADFYSLDKPEKEAVYADITELLYEKLCDGSVTLKDMLLDNLVIENSTLNSDTDEIIQDCEWDL